MGNDTVEDIPSACYKCIDKLLQVIHFGLRTTILEESSISISPSYLIGVAHVSDPNQSVTSMAILWLSASIWV